MSRSDLQIHITYRDYHTTIPKDSRGNICTGKNYRGITLCSSIAKVIDIVMLMRYSHLLNTTNMQYAFKKGHSTVMCTLVLKEVMNYYLNNSDVYTCLIDAIKAFDHIRYDKLLPDINRQRNACISSECWTCTKGR